MQEVLPCRPIRESDLDVIDRLTNDPAVLGPYAWTGWSNSAKLRRQWAETGCLTDDGGMLAVVRNDDAPIGFVTWRKVIYNATSHCWNIGMCMLPEERRKGGAEAATRWFIDYLFAHTQVNRIEAHIDMDNAAARHGSDKVGFVSEGVVRGAAFRDGQWRDLMLYSILRSDPRPSAPSMQK
jgi:RimJ/RimL family protein N-acetyltransferase